MEIIKLISPDYMNNLEVIRVANRGIVIKDNLVLLCYEEDDDQYIIPGGGLEDNETNIEGCIREVKEETGVIVNVKKEYLVIDEFFLNMEHINHYFICEVKEETNKLNLTDLEIKHNLKSMWIDINEAIKIFGKYNEYKDNIPKYGLYKREYLALCKYLEYKD
jgi:ADP-ribose pyrophosphatase YjhB (NUDIX family)